MSNKTAVITNILSHYRKTIFDLLIENKFTIYGDVGNKNGIKIINIDNNDGYKRLKNTYFKSIVIWQKGVLKLFKKDYDSYILIGDMYILSSWFFLIMARLKNKKVLLWGHGLRGNESNIKKKIRLIFLNLSDGLLLYGNKAKSELIKLGYKKPITVVYNSLDYDKQNELYKIYNNEVVANFKEKLFNNDDDILIYSGRITENKKLEQLIDAVGFIKEMYNIDLNILIIGDGKYFEELKKYSETKSIVVLFYGSCYQEEELSLLFQSSKICVSPGDIGLTVMHSFVYGIPVITHDDFNSHGPEHEAIINGETGAFFKKNNYESLANVIVDLLNKNEVDMMKSKCREVVKKRYNPKVQIKIIKKALGK